MTFVSRPLAPFGAEIIGLDLEQPLSDETAAKIRELWVEAGILLFRGAGTSADAHLRLSRVFGDPQPSATAKLNLQENPYLMALTNTPGDKSSKTYTVFEVNGQQRTGWLGWHWDQSFMPEIVRGAVLRMLEPAKVDGRTGFIDAIAAYDQLPATLKQRIQNLEVAYHFEGRLHAQYVLGMERAESDALLAELADILVDERHAYYHTWQTNDLIVWDNWRVIHSATGVPPNCARHAQRTTIVGDYKMGRYLDPAMANAKPSRRFDD